MTFGEENPRKPKLQLKSWENIRDDFRTGNNDYRKNCNIFSMGMLSHRATIFYLWILTNRWDKSRTQCEGRKNDSDRNNMISIFVCIQYLIGWNFYSLFLIPYFFYCGWTLSLFLCIMSEVILLKTTAPE